MINPILRNHPLHRVMFNPEKPQKHVESFFIKANDPVHERAIWLRLTLFCDGESSNAEVWAVYSDKFAGQGRAAKQSFPISRALIDPERAGLGVGPCSIEEGRSAGVVRGEDFTVAWDLEIRDELPPYQALPSRHLYNSSLLGNKISTPHPSAVFNGRIELWNGVDRHSDCTVVEIKDWRGMQGHVWGKAQPQTYAWTHCNNFIEAPSHAFFEAFSARPSVAGMTAPQMLIGRLVVGEQIYRFDTWRNLLPAKTSNYTPAQWNFLASGPDGEIRGEVKAKPENTVGLHYKNPAGKTLYCTNSKLAEITLEISARSGSRRTLHSKKAAFEVLRDTPSPQIKTVLSA